MTYDEHNLSGAAPARARAGEPMANGSDSEGISPSSMETIDPPPHVPGIFPTGHAPKELPQDLQVPWGWHEFLVFIVLGIIASMVVTRGMAEAAIRIFGANPEEMFGTSMSTAKSVVVLISQALLDFGAILYLYLMVLGRTSAPFWRTIGWRGLSSGPGSFRATALQFLGGGAVLGLVVSFAGAFMNSKESLPIEELLKARVSMLLFAVLGVLVAPLVEETIFRGFLYPIIARRTGITAGIAITGILFGMLHAVQLWGGWGQIALLMLVGIVLTWVRARTGTVAASYFVHLGYNGLQLLGYVIYLVGGARH